MTGRPPKPTALKAIEGNRGKRGLNKNEPDPDLLNDLEPPAWLPDDAKAVWRELAFKMRKAQVLTVLDVPAMEKLCVHLATWRRATLAIRGKHVQKKTRDKDGNKVPAHDVMSPWVIVQSMAFKQATAMLREFGMTPAARSRVMIDPQGSLFGSGEDQKTASYFS